jgi:hypothetical protein
MMMAGASLRTLTATVTMLLVLGMSYGTVYAEPTHVDLSAGAGAPGASGEIKIDFVGTVMVGKVEVKDLPPQPFGSGRFYGAWFVRTDTGDKAFLGALVSDKSIIFTSGGKGAMEFRATHFTTGPNAGSLITLGAAGDNLIVVLIESAINGLTPSPVGPVPGAGLAVSGSF